MDRIELQVVSVPQIVPTRVQIATVNGEDFGVVPRNALPPRSDPHAQFGRFRRYAYGELPQDRSTIDGHAHNVSEHHSDVNLLVLFVKLDQSGLDRFHEETVGRSQAQHITPARTNTLEGVRYALNRNDCP